MKQVKWFTTAVLVGLSTTATVNLSAASLYTWEYGYPLQKKLTRAQRLERRHFAISGRPQQIEPQQRYVERCLLPPTLPREVKPVLLARSEALAPTPAVLKVYALAKEQPLLPTPLEYKPRPPAAIPSKVPQTAQAGPEKLILAKEQHPLPKPPEAKPKPPAVIPSKVPQTTTQTSPEKLTLAKEKPPLPKPTEAKPKPPATISEEEKLDSKLYGAIKPITTQKLKPPPLPPAPPPPALVPIDVGAVEEAIVSVALQQATLYEIVRALAPAGWKVTVDSGRPEIAEGRWNFYTSTQRRDALSDLLSPLNLTYRLFPDFKDKVGNPAPLLLVGDTHVTGEVEYNDYE